ncbi:MAG: type II secretion system protein GspK [Pseudomonadota bacterium]
MPTRYRQTGFVLVLVLAMLVILSILAGTVALITQRLVEQEVQRKRLEDAELDFASTKATVLYLLLTQRMTFGGLTVDESIVMNEADRASSEGMDRPIVLTPVGNEISLDGRAYAGLGSTAFSLQDDRGLLGFNWTSASSMERWWAQLGFDALPAPTLSNLLLDFQDKDDLYRLNSAERDQYESEGRRPPSNRPLATPLELRVVKGWDQALSSLDDSEVMRTLTNARTPAININTAPARVLGVLPGVDADIADRIVARRAIEPFANLYEVYGFIGIAPSDDSQMWLYPADSGTMRLWAPQGGTVQTIHWTLTPWDDGGRPWRENYGLTLPRDNHSSPPALARPAAAVFAKPLPEARKRP